VCRSNTSNTNREPSPLSNLAVGEGDFRFEIKRENSEWTACATFMVTTLKALTWNRQVHIR
jgi:hypothetical protein